MTKIQKTTLVFIVGTILVVLGYDIWAAIHGGETATVSYAIMNSSRKSALVPFAAGLLCGHFFWRIKSPPET